MGAWVRPIERGWLVRDDVPGPDVDEFAEPDRVIAALAEPDAARRSLLAVQHPHRTPAALAAGLGLAGALPTARATLAGLLRAAYRPVTDVIAPYTVDGPDGSAIGLLCLVDPAAVDPDGEHQVRHTEEVYPEVVAERAEMLAGLGCLTSAAMLLPVRGGDTLTEVLRSTVDSAGLPAVSTVDSLGRRHRLWLVEPGPLQDGLLSAAAASPLLVADGNHRVAAAAAAALDGMLALVTAGPGLKVGAFHRVLIGTGLDADALATAWRRVGLNVRPTALTAPEHTGEIVVQAAGRRLLVTLPPGSAIDHAVVEDLLLHKALGLDPESDAVRPLAGDRPPPADADAVLMIAPVPLADVLAVHAAGGRMPRKSTYFTPKPRSGLVLAEQASPGLGSANG